MAEKQRCPWSTNDPDYIRYHDEEWGVPVREDRKQFEFLVLESAQAGLSWLTILKRREGYRRLYDSFAVEKVAEYKEAKILEMLSDPGIIRNRKKIESSINNARRFMEVQKEFGSFCTYLWGFIEDKQVVNHPKEISDVQPSTPLSDTISKDMKKRGFTFVGSTIIYAHLQATGLVNDHLISCFRHSKCSED